MTDQKKILKTQTFIGSSTEGLVVANAIRANLLGITDCQVWTEGLFLPGRTFIETLESMLDQMDYAILVATPDDMLRKKDVETFSMRDNVLLELGLFMAKLGRTRTYLISPSDTSIHIPTDLLGVTTVAYSSSGFSGDMVEQLKEPCDQIKKAMQAAEKELSLAMKRVLVKRLLSLSNRLQGFVVTLQSESIKSLTNQEEFIRIRNESANWLNTLASEYTEDAKKLNVYKEAYDLVQVVLSAVQGIPFPEEAVITTDDFVGGVISHLTGARSAKDQIQERFNKLTARYETWWNKNSPCISTSLTEFQGALISTL